MMKIAIPTDDGVSVSQHFGQAVYFKVLSVEGSQVISAEMREKATHEHGTPSAEGMHPGAIMIESISDCQTLIAGGMGSPVYNRAMAAGLKVILTRQSNIDLAVGDFLAGKLENDPQLVHVH
jgi:predicted Fe-Mo cluster-binding NifX family protein